MRLSDWYAEPVDHRGRMMACVLADAKVEAHRHWWREKQREREADKDRDANTFRAIKQRMRSSPDGPG
jgi:hypothetical protein